MSPIAADEKSGVRQQQSGSPARKQLLAEWGTRADGVLVLAFDQEDNVLLLGQVDAEDRSGHWRLPGARVEPGETPLEAAIEGLHREGGLRAASWSSSGSTSAVESTRYPVHHFEAQNVREEPELARPEGGALRSWFGLDEAIAMALDGRIGDPLSALQILRWR